MKNITILLTSFGFISLMTDIQKSYSSETDLIKRVKAIETSTVINSLETVKNVGETSINEKAQNAAEKEKSKIKKLKS